MCNRFIPNIMFKKTIHDIMIFLYSYFACRYIIACFHNLRIKIQRNVLLDRVVMFLTYFNAKHLQLFAYIQFDNQFGIGDLSTGAVVRSWMLSNYVSTAGQFNVSTKTTHTKEFIGVKILCFFKTLLFL